MLNFSTRKHGMEVVNSLKKLLPPFLEEKQKEKDFYIYEKLIRFCNSDESSRYLTSGGRNSDVFGFSTDFIIKINRKNNEHIPYSEFIAQPYLQICGLHGYAIEIYDMAVNFSKKISFDARWCLQNALKREGISVLDFNIGATLINTRTGILQVVDTEDCKRIKPLEQAIEEYDELLKDSICHQRGKNNDDIIYPRVPSFEEIQENTYFPEVMKYTTTPLHDFESHSDEWIILEQSL